jgi:hypothetical protein
MSRSPAVRRGKNVKRNDEQAQRTSPWSNITSTIMLLTMYRSIFLVRPGLDEVLARCFAFTGRNEELIRNLMPYKVVAIFFANDHETHAND